jgi:hypothetical protein
MISSCSDPRRRNQRILRHCESVPSPAGKFPSQQWNYRQLEPLSPLTLAARRRDRRPEVAAGRIEVGTRGVPQPFWRAMLEPMSKKTTRRDPRRPIQAAVLPQVRKRADSVHPEIVARANQHRQLLLSLDHYCTSMARRVLSGRGAFVANADL